MIQDFPQYGIAVLCGLFGKTRHAYYDWLWRKESSLVKEDVILREVASIRKELPRIGIRKLHCLLQNTLGTHEITLGRDYLFDLLSEHKLLIRQRKTKSDYHRLPALDEEVQQFNKWMEVTSLNRCGQAILLTSA